MMNNFTTNRNLAKADEGFSIIELMIVIGLIAVGFLATLALQISTVSQNSGAQKVTDELVFAEDIIEEFLSKDFDDSDLDPSLNPHTIIDNAYTMVWNVATADMNGDGVDDAKNIQLTVTHQKDQDKEVKLNFLVPEL